MKLLFMVLYFVVSSIIYGVLTRLAAVSGRWTPKVERNIVLLFLVWPV